MRDGGCCKEGVKLGDYRLLSLFSEGPSTQVWAAEQLSLQRPVMLEVLKGLARQDEGVVASFLADVKSKARVSHPGVGSVYEAVCNGESIFFAHEWIEGKSLKNLCEEGRRFSPGEVVEFLGQISEMMLHFEDAGIAIADYELRHFVVSEDREIRLVNLAVNGERDEAVGTRVKQRLGRMFGEMLVEGVPGSTRVGSLCDFMADLERPHPLAWAQILSLSQQVHEQLVRSEVVSAPKGKGLDPVYLSPRKSLKIPIAIWVFLGGCGLIALLITSLVFMRDRKKPLPRVEVAAGYVEVPAGEYALKGEQIVTIRESFTLSRTEVTLAQYHAFLELSDHRQFEHPEQPSSKVGHLPDSWKGIWSAAVKGEMWKGRAMSTTCPVVGVDWWDAYAYAKWSQGRLPTLDEWAVAASYQGPPVGIKSWGPVAQGDGDETGAGLVGMAGGVREWTRDVEVGSASQLSLKRPVMVGGSFLEAGQGIYERVWADDRGLRFSDLGFRLVLKK